MILLSKKNDFERLIGDLFNHLRRLHCFMKTDKIFVLLLVVLLPMTGCFDDAVGDAEGTDEADGTSDTGNNGGTQAGDTANSQARTWYSSGDTYATTWTDGLGTQSGSERCMEWGPSYDSQTGEYIGEECRRYGLPTMESDWNVSECTEVGGTPFWSSLDTYNNTDDDNNESTNYAYRWAPTCTDIPILTINTNSGEALIIYQWTNGPSFTSTCDGVSVGTSLYYLGGSAGQESIVITGSAMNCTHELTRTMQYGSSTPNFSIWSIVYAIQDTTVV